MKVLTTIGLILTSLCAIGQENVFDSLEHQAYQRLYVTHLPPTYDGITPTPVVIVLHGGSGTYVNAQGFTQMNFVSNQNNFLAVYPQGIGSAPPGYSWADGRNTTADQAGIDDVGFISKLIDTLSFDFNIDTTKVYVCGFSNGGFMTQRLACEIPYRFAAIGGLGCSLDTALIQSCDPSQAIPMAYFSGTADPEVPYIGGAMNNPSVTPIVAVDTAVQFWVDNNNCQAIETVVNIPNTVTSDNSEVEFYKYTDCDCNADVYFYKIINGGHTWPGVPIPQFPQLGNTNEDIHASYELWDFFDQFSLCNLTTDITEEIENNDLNAFPNPAQDIIYIQSQKQIISTSIFDLMGRKVIEQNSDEINLQSLPSGAYLLRVQYMDNKMAMIKIMKR